MSNEREKIVDFKSHCPGCQHAKLKETEEPCNECLSVGARPNTRRPLNYVQGGGGENGGYKNDSRKSRARKHSKRK